VSGHTFGPTGRRKSALLWGVVGVLSFLVLVQGYALLAEPIVPIGRALTIAAPVGIGATIGAYVLEPRVAARAADRAEE
jgi:putative flippase GtrA